MFTGIVRAIGRVMTVQTRGGDVRLVVDAAALINSVTGAREDNDTRKASYTLGDSIAVNGVCLTVVAIEGSHLAFDVSVESLSLTTLKHLTAGSRVNLEPAATPRTALGGHIVSGHVDTMATVVERTPDARSQRFTLQMPPAFARYIAPKGSVTLDGVSLTVNGVAGNRFDINIVPHTMERTIIDGYAPGTEVNLEVDVLARYVERLLEARADGQ
ncbi:MAG: riboflavin synthase [Gammaproteobacteria bacterium]|nr:riboflavin synthase [Gammaproteobacteria bacterium]